MDFSLPTDVCWDTHFLAFSYGDWMHLLGINQGVEKMMRSDLSRLSQLTDLVRARLLPSVDQIIELRDIAPGEVGAKRTLDWIDASLNWSLDGKEIAVAPRAALIRRGAAEVLSDNIRPQRQQDSARALLAGLLGANSLAATCAKPVGFDLLTKKATEMRGAISNALFRTARVAGDDEWLALNATQVAAAGFPFFVKSAWDWDVRPSA